MDAGRKTAPGLDMLETVMLGGTPGDALESPAGTLGGTGALRDPRQARLDSLRGLLTEQPALRKQVEAEVSRMWAKSKGERLAFQAAVGELRAQVLSQAQMQRFRRQAPDAAVRAQQELRRYLAEIEGLGP